VVVGERFDLELDHYAASAEEVDPLSKTEDPVFGEPPVAVTQPRADNIARRTLMHPAAKFCDMIKEGVVKEYDVAVGSDAAVCLDAFQRLIESAR